jgi:hypothetical protein
MAEEKRGVIEPGRTPGLAPQPGEKQATDRGDADLVKRAADAAAAALKQDVRATGPRDQG